ncbi:Double-stranded RNA-binding protein [Corchorus olitorius]|uniref:Double-stranded RNA-binding protein n=1 Tax=Corchorus olitorius TaxID=93759 RepID=A0A1R3JLH4_9ROSI|nr:Double-stranded RNA-binding protein [Corchorus olitorius]
MHKNRLNTYAQRLSMQHPVYQTVNEGPPHVPRFRSTVVVDGISYTSVNTFSHRKAAEQDVAKLALESIAKKIKDEGWPLIREDTAFCKSILHEYAVKMNLEMPTYSTIQPEVSVPYFVTSLVFNGVTYNGNCGRNKKEAEQLAARAVLRSLLDDPRYGTFLSEIIKSKAKLFNAVNKVKDLSFSHPASVPSGANMLIHKNTEVETAAVTDSTSTGAILQPSSGAKPPHHELIHETKEVETAVVPDRVPTTAILQPISAKPPHHEFRICKLEQEAECVNLPITFVPSALEQSSDVGQSSSSKRRKKKKRAKLHNDTQLAIAAIPLHQVESSQWPAVNIKQEASC